MHTDDSRATAVLERFETAEWWITLQKCVGRAWAASTSGSSIMSAWTGVSNRKASDDNSMPLLVKPGPRHHMKLKWTVEALMCSRLFSRRRFSRHQQSFWSMRRVTEANGRLLWQVTSHSFWHRSGNYAEAWPSGCCLEFLQHAQNPESRPWQSPVNIMSTYKRSHGKVDTCKDRVPCDDYRVALTWLMTWKRRLTCPKNVSRGESKCHTDLLKPESERPLVCLSENFRFFQLVTLHACAVRHALPARCLILVMHALAAMGSPSSKGGWETYCRCRGI